MLRHQNAILLESSARHHLSTLKDDFHRYLYTASKEFKIAPDEQKKREDFLNNRQSDSVYYTFDSFYWFFTHSLTQLTIDEIDTLATSKESANIREIQACYNILNDVGFHKVNGKKINFWSGQLAKQAAKSDAQGFCDDHIPAINIIFYLLKLIEEKENSLKTANNLSKLLVHLNSAIFASQASGIVNVYFASDKKSEIKSGLTAGNNFWISELPVLQKLRKDNIVKEIRFNILVGNIWKEIDFNDIPVYRRIAYHVGSLSDDQRERFCPNSYVSCNSEQFLVWQHSRPRPFIKLENLKKVTHQWLDITKKPYVLDWAPDFAKSINDAGITVSQIFKVSEEDVANLISTNNVDSRNEYQDTPLIRASVSGNVKIARMLIEAKANINAKNDRGDTPLMGAAYENRIGMIALLLKNHAGVDEGNNHGTTALIWAVKRGHYQSVKLLLEGNANPLQTNHYRKSALTCAVETRQLPMIKLLSNAMNVTFFNYCTSTQSVVSSKHRVLKY